MADEKKKELTSFEKLLGLNVNDHTEKKNTGTQEKPIYLTYLSWAWAWAEFKKAHNDAFYKIHEFPNKNGDLVPYLEDEDFGLMVWTTVSAGGESYEMWLPVMDGANRSMKRKPYTIKVKNYDVTVKGATMFDINKSIMRCLVKNLAMFGLGLYIYAGEDLPEELTDEVEEPKEKKVDAKTLQDFNKTVEKLSSYEDGSLDKEQEKVVVDWVVNFQKKLEKQYPQLAGQVEDLLQKKMKKDELV